MRTGCANARTLIVYIYIAIEATRNGTTTRLLYLSSIRSFGQRSRSRVSSTQSASPLPRLNVFDDPRFSTSYSFVSMLLLASVPRPRTWSCRKRSTPRLQKVLSAATTAGESARVFRRAQSERGWSRCRKEPDTPRNCVNARSDWSVTMPTPPPRNGRRFDPSRRS